MDEIPIYSNKDVGQFVQKTLKNLAFIEEAADKKNDVDLVTQLIVSMLGLIVLPLAEDTKKWLEDRTLADVTPDGVQLWRITFGESKNLYGHFRHLSNAIAHMRINTQPHVEHLEEVIEFDAPANDKPVTWRAEIRARDLRNFCVAFGEKLREM